MGELNVLRSALVCPPGVCLCFIYIYLFREVKDQAQPTEKAGEKVLEELKNLRSKALSSYLILE